jgi:hypothetical protein
MAQQNSSGRQSSGVSTVNLNALNADSVQLDYIAREQQAAGELLTIQTKNAQALSKIRLDLLSKLMDETKKQGEEVETELADFKSAKALENLALEIKEVKAGYQKLYNEQLAIQQKNLSAIRQAEADIASFRLSAIKMESAARLRDIALAEKATIDSLKRRSALDPGFNIDSKALEDAELDINETLSGLESSLLELETNHLQIASEAIKQESELRASTIDAELQQRQKAMNSLNADATNAEATLTEGVQTAADQATSAIATMERALGGLVAATEAAELEESTGAADAPKAAAEAPKPVVIPDAEEERHKKILAGLTAQEQAEHALWQERVKHIDTEHIRRMICTEDGLKRYKVSTAEQIALEEELTRRKKENEADVLASLFVEREDAEKKAADEQEKRNAERLKKRYSLELDYLSKLKTEKGGPAKYNNKFMQDMMTQQTTIQSKDEDGKVVQTTKTKAEMSLAELDQVQKAEKESLQDASLDNNEILKALAEQKVAENKEAGLTGDSLDITKVFEEIKAAEIAKLTETQELERQFITDRAKAAEEADKELNGSRKHMQENFAKSKVGSAIENTKNLTKSLNVKERIANGEDSETVRADAQAALDKAGEAIGNFVTQLNDKGKESASKKGFVDTAMQGSGADKTMLGSYWDKISDKITMGVGVSPVVKQENVEKSVETLAGMGITYNLEQRAFLMTIKDKIATTFEVADGTMRKLIRIQQSDTTAARLGMESALTSFLNSMYDTSEFMKETAGAIRQSLYEATALMEAERAAEYEYQVQKWTGALFSVGFSSSEKVAETLGKLTAGDISGITEGGMGNLLIMAANEASIPIAEILEKGLTPDETNSLMESMVKYLARIYDDTHGSNVLAQQYAGVFGVSASDLKAAANLMAEGFDNLTKEKKSYSQMEGQLKKMTNSMIMRTSQAEIMTNLKENLSYTFATTLANNPVLSGLNNMANMLNDLVGGIEIPFINVYSFGFDLNATIADLMNVAALSGTVLGGMGKLVAGLAKTSTGGLLGAMGINLGGKAAKMEHKGQQLSLTSLGGSTTSASGSIAGNENGDDIKNKTIQDNSEDPEKQIAEAKEEQEDKENARTQLIAGHIIDIYNLLNEVTLGSKKWHVQLEVGNAPSTWASGTWT